jgi:hypothetical protein
MFGKMRYFAIVLNNTVCRWHFASCLRNPVLEYGPENVCPEIYRVHPQSFIQMLEYNPKHATTIFFYVLPNYLFKYDSKNNHLTNS